MSHPTLGYHFELNGPGIAEHWLGSMHLYPYITPTKIVGPALLKGFLGGKAGSQRGQRVGFTKTIVHFSLGEMTLDKALEVVLPNAADALEFYDVGSNGDDRHS